MTIREYKQKFIQLERFAPRFCTTDKARTSKFILGLQVCTQGPSGKSMTQDIAEAAVITCVSEDVLTKQYRPMTTKDKTKSVSTQDQSIKKNKEGDKRKRNDDEKGNKDIPLCHRILVSVELEEKFWVY